MNKKLQKIFQSVVGGKNFITPDVVDFYRRGNYIIEVSEGRGLFHKYVIGVTIVNETTMKQEREKDKCFLSDVRRNALNDALTYIDSL